MCNERTSYGGIRLYFPLFHWLDGTVWDTSLAKEGRWCFWDGFALFFLACIWILHLFSVCFFAFSVFFSVLAFRYYPILHLAWIFDFFVWTGTETRFFPFHIWSHCKECHWRKN